MSNKKRISLTDSVSVEDARFIIAINKDARELYALHREFPRCLIYIESLTPVNFVVADFYEADNDREKAIQILTSKEFKKELITWYAKQAINLSELN